jgi:hypothetical protein
MPQSILNSIKPLLGIQVSDTSFDTNLIVHINSVFMILNQLGVGPDDVFSIEDNTTTWDEFLTAGDENYLALTKSYMMLKVQMIFDPSTSGVVSGSTERLITEMESRLVTQDEIRPVV